MRLCQFLALLTLPLLSIAAPYSAFQDGESYSYRVGWGPLGHAGEIKITAKHETYEGRPAVRITMITSSKGLVRGLYSYDSHSEAIIDVASNRIIRATEVSEGAEKMSDATTTFDYEHRRVTHEDKVRPGRNRDFPMPEGGDPLDLISVLVGSREWATSVGLKRDAIIFAGQDVYPVTIYGDSIETLETETGEVQALMLIPRMEKEPARGVFKRGGEIKVWVSQDSDRLPVRMQLKLKIGTARLVLIDHSLPAPAVGKTDAATVSTDKTAPAKNAPST